MLSLLFKSKGKWNDVAVPNAAFNYVPFTIQQRGRTFRPAPPWNIRTEANITVAKSYYIKPDGSDAADGLSEANALKTFAAAFDKADIDRLYVKAGTYDCQNTGVGYLDIHRTMEIIGYGGAVILNNDISYMKGEWVAVGNHYTTTLAGPGVVLDKSRLNFYSDYLRYRPATSEAEVDATPGSYWWNAGIEYVRCIDDRVPDANLLLLYLGTSLRASLDNTTIYVDGLSFVGMGLGLGAATAARGFKFFMNNCSVKYYAGWYIFTIDSADLVILKNTTVADNFWTSGDGVHCDDTGTATNIIEIDCTMYNIGKTGDGASNLSSMHNDADAVRINGVYYDSWARGVHDIHTGKTWCLGSISKRVQSNHPSAAGGLSVGFCNGNTREMWLDSCTTIGQLNYDLQQADANLYSRNHSGDKGANSGVITPY
jgi:hypothetical protein